MSLNLPTPISAYYAASNAHNIDAMLATFAETARVKDEGHDHRGHAAIRTWLEDTTRRYRATATPEEASWTDEQLVVRALVAGNFPGSPARLTYRFAIADNRISTLEIG